MKTRRNFLTAGVVFCGCCLLDQAQAQQTGPRKLPVAVAGKRVKTIDVHAHCHFREAGALLGADAAAVQLPPVNGRMSASATPPAPGRARTRSTRLRRNDTLRSAGS